MKRTIAGQVYIRAWDEFRQSAGEFGPTPSMTEKNVREFLMFLDLDRRHSDDNKEKLLQILEGLGISGVNEDA
jgi:hypothetical protein